MSAAELRSAAALIRERAEGATPGPWTLYHDGISGPAVADEVTAPDCGCGGGILSEDTEAFIAAWDPTVALAFADLLDDLADVDTVRRPSLVQASALKAARAYMGGDS